MTVPTQSLHPYAPTAASRLRLPAYLLLGFMALLPLFDFLISAWPIRAGEVAWRFGAFGQLSASAAAPLVAILLLYWIAYANADRKAMYFCAVLASIYAVLLIAAMVSFPLDAMQMRRRVAAAAQSKFSLMSATAVLRLAFYALGAVTLAVSLYRSARLIVPGSSVREDPASALVMRNLSGRLRPTPSLSMPAQSEPSASEGKRTIDE